MLKPLLTLTGFRPFKRLVAPFSGVVTARNVNIGDYVTADGGNTSQRGTAQPLFEVADVHRMRIFVSVPQNFSDALKPGLTATLTLPQAPGKKIALQFLATAKAVAAATRTVITAPSASPKSPRRNPRKALAPPSASSRRARTATTWSWPSRRCCAERPRCS